MQDQGFHLVQDRSNREQEGREPVDFSLPSTSNACRGLVAFSFALAGVCRSSTVRIWSIKAHNQLDQLVHQEPNFLAKCSLSFPLTPSVPPGMRRPERG